MEPTDHQHRRAVRVYMAILAFAALAAGLSDSLYSNYFKDAYDVTALQRGLIEFPRELPGFLVVFIVTLLSALGGTRIAILAQVLAVIGLTGLGFLTPPFAVMLIFLFINSLGGHLWYPQQDNLGLRLIRSENDAGRTIGRFKGVSTAFGMLASLIAFVGFRTGFFSLTSPVKLVFVIALAFFLVVLVLLVVLERLIDRRPAAAPAGTAEDKPARKFRFVFRREYRYYYLLAIVFGVQKQIMFVYGPWVLIDLLDKKADTIALLGMFAAFCGIFFIPALGRWLDRFGIQTMLYADAISFIGVYLGYGLLSAGFSTGILPRAGLPVILAFILFVVDRMSMQMGMIRSLYLRAIALSPADIAPTLTLGQSMDHVVSIICATLGGVIWGTWGPQYIFFLAAALSLINYFVATRARIVKPGPAADRPV